MHPRANPQLISMKAHSVKSLIAMLPLVVVVFHGCLFRG